MRYAASLGAWFVLLTALWLVYAGTRRTDEVVAGLLAAAAGTALVAGLRRLGLPSLRADPRLLTRLARLPANLVFDFLVVTWVLVRSLTRGRRVRGEWVTVAFDAGGGPRGRWRRAVGAAAGNTFPNALVVDVEADRALLHALEPGVYTARSVL